MTDGPSWNQVLDSTVGAARVLVADNDEHLLDVVGSALRSHGYHCVTERTGSAALQMLASERFDVLLVDLDMPEVDGFDILSSIAKNHCDTVAVVLTGSGDIPRAVRAMKLGAYDFIEKPCRLRELAGVIERAANYRRVRVATSELACKAARESTELADAYNSLRVAQDSLEVLVRERTNELVELNMRLREEVSQRKQVERSLRGSEQTLRAIADTALDSILMMDQEGAVCFVNQAAERTFGWPASEMLGKSLHGLVAPNRYTPDVAKGLAEFRSSGTGPSVGKRRELTARRKDGSEFPAQIALNRVLFNGEWHAVGIVRDLTEEKRASAELERLMAAIEQAAEIILITDVAGTIQYVNPAFEKVTGYTATEVLGRNPSILKSGKIGEHEYKRLWETISRGETFKGRVVNRRKDGVLYTADVTISPVRDAADKIVNYVAVQRDVTRELALESENNQAQKLESVGRLAAGIAHEINTPTQYVGDNIEFLQLAFESLIELAMLMSALGETKNGDKIPEELMAKARLLAEKVNLDYFAEQVPRAIEQSLEGITRIATIVQAMKEFSHPGSVEKTLVDLNQCIRSTATVSRNEWKYIAELEMELDESLPRVMCLPGDFNQAILNLIVNAAHAVEDAHAKDPGGKGTISISTRQDGAWVEIQVSDTGSGIPESIRSRIFDPFFTTKEVGKGTGQGLAIARSTIVDKHAGTLEVRSAANTGTTFIIRLPIKGAGAPETTFDESIG